MNGLMMEFPLNIPAILRRAEERFRGRPVSWRLADGRIRRATYGDCLDRARALAAALTDLGVRPGDRVATLLWNQGEHLEAYLAVPGMGAVLHTLNPRLPVDDLAYIVNHAEDRVVLIDHTLWPVWDRIRSRVSVPHVIWVGPGAPTDGILDYETLISQADGSRFVYPDLPEERAAALCYTSGTTGRPKGVLYSHRSTVLHSLASLLADGIGITGRDRVLPVVPMFHVNGWGLPYTAVMVGAGLSLPGPRLDAVSVLDMLAEDGVTLTAGVPTVWLAILEALDREPKRWDLSRLRAMMVGGSAPPEAMIRGFYERHGLEVVQGWGMTETSPVGLFNGDPSPDLGPLAQDDVLRLRAKQGLPLPLFEVRAMGPDGPVPWDGHSYGELEVRGPWVARAYYGEDDPGESFTPDGWFRTGDIVTIDPYGYVEVQDRAKDLVKSGGEWISSVTLENTLMGHPAVAEAAVIAVPHPKWKERPVAVVVLRAGANASETELKEWLAARFPRWWVPDRVVFTEAIPRTAAGKFLKRALRERYPSFDALPGATEEGA